MLEGRNEYSKLPKNSEKLIDAPLENGSFEEKQVVKYDNCYYC